MSGGTNSSGSSEHPGPWSDTYATEWPSRSTRNPIVGLVWRTQRDRTLAPLIAKSSLPAPWNRTVPWSSSGVIGK